MKSSNSIPSPLALTLGNGSPKPDAGTPEQALRTCGFITCRSSHGVQHIRQKDIVTFGVCVEGQTDQHGRIIGTPQVALGKCAIILAGVGQIIVNHSTETVGQIIADFHK